jgi:glyceraldehyde 3-phosphate dehydrogenase
VAATRIGINGFGRIGRMALRAAWGWPELTFAHINEPAGDAETAAHLLTFDSVHGRWPHDARAVGDGLAIDDGTLGYSRSAEPGGVPWGELGVEIVLECSGRFRTREALGGFFAQGVRKVIVAAPVKRGALNVVVGVNDDRYDPGQHDVLTAASCTTNCLAPVVKVIHEAIGIQHGAVTTLHDMTNTQTLVDAPHKDLRRARAATLSLIPTTTGSAAAIGLIFPELEGRLNGLAVRVPLLNASSRSRAPRPQKRSTRCSRPRPRGRSPESSDTRSGRSSRSTTRTTRARRSSMRSRRWSSTGRR